MYNHYMAVQMTEIYKFQQYLKSYDENISLEEAVKKWVELGKATIFRQMYNNHYSELEELAKRYENNPQKINEYPYIPLGKLDEILEI